MIVTFILWNGPEFYEYRPRKAFELAKGPMLARVLIKSMTILDHPLGF